MTRILKYMRKQLENVLFEQSIGLDINALSVRVVVLGRFLRHLRILKWGEESVLDSNPENISESILILFKRLNIKNREVVVHLQGRGVRYLIIDAPRLTREAFKPFIAKELAKRLPPGLHVSRLIFDSQILNASSTGFKVLVVFCQPNLYQDTLDILKSAGLEPIKVGGSSFDVLSAYSISDPEYFNNNECYVFCSGTSMDLFLTQNGQLVHINQIPVNDYQQKTIHQLHSELKQLISHLEKDEKKSIKRVALIGPHAKTVKNQLKELNVNVNIGIPLKSIYPKLSELASSFSLASGLAVKGFFQDFSPLNLMPSDIKPTIFEAQEKKKTMRNIFLMGAAVCILMLLMNIIRWTTMDRLAASEEQMLEMNDRITTVELSEKEEKKLRRDLQKMQTLMTERSQIAELMSEVGVHIPKRIWLHQLYIGTEPSNDDTMSPKSIVYLEGLSISEDKITQLIAALEKSVFFNVVRLQETRKLSRDEVWELTETFKRSVIQFKILLELL